MSRGPCRCRHRDRPRRPQDLRREHVDPHDRQIASRLSRLLDEGIEVHLVEHVRSDNSGGGEKSDRWAAEQLSKEIAQMGKEAGFKVTIFNKARIEKEKMGGKRAASGNTSA